MTALFETPPGTPRTPIGSTPTGSVGYTTTPCSSVRWCAGLVTPKKHYGSYKEKERETIRNGSWNEYEAWHERCLVTPKKRMATMIEEEEDLVVGSLDGVKYSVTHVDTLFLAKTLAFVESPALPDYKACWADSAGYVVQTLPVPGQTVGMLSRGVTPQQVTCMRRNLTDLLSSLHDVGASLSSFSPDSVVGSIQTGYRITNIQDITPLEGSGSGDFKALNDFLTSLAFSEPNTDQCEPQVEERELQGNEYLVEIYREILKCKKMLGQC
eukprot:TRINITY_DN2380_c5_g1_i1.p1 TRINITY_DN2380_c5_g1~~TRINITY_DN2380_c5_g1_i1.p1  ORF type:complete len:269 (+),score=35.41 TRINITY_DN2380_c5_g1_i1:133-939(+)